jgi:hypothetical protein
MRNTATRTRTTKNQGKSLHGDRANGLTGAPFLLLGGILTRLLSVMVFVAGTRIADVGVHW